MRWIPLLIVPLLAGCSTSDLVDAHVVITGGDIEADDPMLFDPADRPTAAMYQANGRDHPGFYTAHDLLEEWAHIHGHTLETEWFDSDFGYGFALCAIDDFPPRQHDDTTRGCFERGGFWALSQNGEAVEVGMSDLQVEASDTITFTWTTF